MQKWKRRQTLTAYTFMAIPLLFAVVFTYYPMIANFVLSFFEYDVLNPPKFVGLDNFKRALSDPTVANAFKNSFKYLLVVPVIQLVAFALALLVNRSWPGISLFRSLFFFPVITPMIVVSLAWKWIFQSDGILNYVLQAIGLTSRPILFLSHPNYALWSVMFVTFWTGIGYYMMIYLAGLQGVPEETWRRRSWTVRVRGTCLHKSCFPSCVRIFCSAPSCPPSARWACSPRCMR